MFGFGNFFTLKDEQGVLRASITATLLIAMTGIAFGLVTGSSSIVFDGIYSMIDSSMTLLSLFVASLITSFSTSSGLSRKLSKRFSMGFWHLEPMVLGLNGTMLIGVAVYALVNAVSSLLEGGRELEFGWAIVYGAISVLVCFSFALMASRANRRINSDFLRLDVKGWLMAGGISAALLIAFLIGFAVQGTEWQWISPYVDPAILALVCVIIIPMPISTVRQALADIFLVTPAELKAHVDEAARAFVEKHGLESWRSYVANTGRLRQIELYLIVPQDAPARTIAQWDALRDEIGDAIGGEGPDRWLTVVFTGDREWAE